MELLNFLDHGRVVTSLILCYLSWMTFEILRDVCYRLQRHPQMLIICRTCFNIISRVLQKMIVSKSIVWKCRARFAIVSAVVLGTETSASTLALAFNKMHVCVWAFFTLCLPLCILFVRFVFFSVSMPPSLMTRLIGFLHPNYKFKYIHGLWIRFGLLLLTFRGMLCITVWYILQKHKILETVLLGATWILTKRLKLKLIVFIFMQKYE